MNLIKGFYLEYIYNEPSKPNNKNEQKIWIDPSPKKTCRCQIACKNMLNIKSLGKCKLE